MIGFDSGVMIVLMLMIKQRGILPSRLLLYAANPLILLYISGEGHLDIIQVFFLCLALYLILCRKFPATGFLMLGLAILSKYFALAALPFLVNAENRTKSVAVLIPLMLYIPFMDAGAGTSFSATSTPPKREPPLPDLRMANCCHAHRRQRWMCGAVHSM